MDSVGYGVSAATLDEAEWKTPACVDLVKYLTIGKEMQTTSPIRVRSFPTSSRCASSS